MLRLTATKTTRKYSQRRAYTTRPPFTWAPPTEADGRHYDPEEVFRAGVRHHHLCNTAYPIAHLDTIRSYRVPRLREQVEIKETLRGAYGNLKEMMLYVHVPMCHTRCQFCEYTVIDPKQGRSGDVQKTYFDALMDEFRLYDEVVETHTKRLVGFDIGGGTPSMASISEIGRIMDAARRHFDFSDKLEISIETTPKIAAAEPEKIHAYRKMGIRRISMGLQTTDFTLSKKLGRDDANANMDYVQKAVSNIREAGFDSFNIDLMYGFPLSLRSSDPWPHTVQDCIDLKPDHVTLYRMRYKGTKMAHLQDRVKLSQVNFQESLARKILEENGYRGMVGKNTFSRTPGSSGCSDYLDKRVVRGIPYLGYGLGAQSFSRHTLQYNLGAVTKKLDQYIRSLELGRIPIQDLYHLSARAAMAKMISVSFYYGGVDLDAFKDCFGVELLDIFPSEVEFLISKKLMVLENYNETNPSFIYGDNNRRLQMTPAGKRHFGGVVALFYSPAVQNHVIKLAGGEIFSEDIIHTLDAENSTNTQQTTSKLGKEISQNEAQSLQINSPQLKRAQQLKIEHTKLAQQLKIEHTKLAQQLKIEHAKLAEQSKIERENLFPKENGPEFSSETSPFEFGNILFGGPCNQRCYFCVGKNFIESEKSPNNLRIFPLLNLEKFLELMIENKVAKMIMTGTTTDPQLYKYELDLIQHVRARIPGIHISVHTNGILALQKLREFNSYNSATISLNSFTPSIYEKIHGVRTMPDLSEIMNSAEIPVKLSCVLTEENSHEIPEYISKTKSLGIKRIAFRHLFTIPVNGQTEQKKFLSENFPGIHPFFVKLSPTKWFAGNPVYTIDGIEVTYWIFENMSRKSLNLFADGTISDKYLLTEAPNAKKKSVFDDDTKNISQKKEQTQ